MRRRDLEGCKKNMKKKKKNKDNEEEQEGEGRKRNDEQERNSRIKHHSHSPITPQYHRPRIIRPLPHHHPPEDQAHQQRRPEQHIAHRVQRRACQTGCIAGGAGALVGEEDRRVER